MLLPDPNYPVNRELPEEEEYSEDESRLANESALLAAIDAAEENSIGGDTDGQLDQERSLAIRMYLGENVDPAPEGRSQAVSRDVYDTIEWIKPSLMRIYASTDEVVACEPEGPGDEEQAKQETQYLNWVVTRKNNWAQIFNDWATDALLTKNAYCMAYWDESKAVEYETYTGKTDDEMAMLVQDQPEILEHKSYPDTQSPPQPVMGPMGPMIDPNTGQPVMQPVMLHDVKVRRIKQSGQVKLCVLPPERVRIDNKTADYTVTTANYFEVWEYKTLSALRAMGLEVDDDISDDGGSDTLAEENARDRYNEFMNQADSSYSDPSMRLVKLRMIWIRYDYDGDGIAELQYVLRVGQTILYREECNRIPVGCIVPIPMPHRHMGLSVAETVAELQAIKTAILRQGLDGLYLANHPRTFASDKINLDDLLTSTPGGVVRGAPGAVYGQDLAPIVTPNVFPNAIQGMEYMDSIRQNRTGVNNYFSGTDANSINKTASGISQLTASAGQRVENIARMFQPGVEYLFSCAHELILKHAKQPETIKLTGGWVTVDPREWKTNRNVRLSVGLGTGNKDQVMQQLASIYSTQKEVMPLGLTNEQKVYNTLSELAKVSGFSSADQFYVNPTDPNWQKPQPQPDPFKIAEVQAKQKELEIKDYQAKTDRMQVTGDHAFKLKEAKSEGKQAPIKGFVLKDTEEGQVLVPREELDSMENEAMEKQQTEQMIALMAQAIQQMAQTSQILAASAAQMAAPKELIYDKSGKVIGSRTVTNG